MAESTLHTPSPAPATHHDPRRRMLVAYATKHGSTREVAEAIATTPQEQGCRVDLCAAADCHDLSEYRMDERSVRGARRQLDNALRRFSDPDPVAVTIFGGVIDPSKLRFPFSRMKPGDARDWNAIRAWAAELASRLASSDIPSVNGA